MSRNVSSDEVGWDDLFFLVGFKIFSSKVLKCHDNALGMVLFHAVLDTLGSIEGLVS